MAEHLRRCANVVALLADYLERQLPPDVHSDLERHLARCSRCIAQLKTYQATVSILRSVKEDDLPRELRCTLRAFIDRNCQN
jgi:anti-sigma factor RsiW